MNTRFHYKYILLFFIMILAAGCKGKPVDRPELLTAANDGDYDQVKQLLDDNANIHLTDEMGFTALSHAANEGHIKIIELLLESGADINKNVKFAGTPLMRAVHSGRKDVVTLLIDNGADVNLKEVQSNASALFIAKSKKHEDIIKILKAAGAK